jgi:hypothetical protein
MFPYSYPLAGCSALGHEAITVDKWVHVLRRSIGDQLAVCAHGLPTISTSRGIEGSRDTLGKLGIAQVSFCIPCLLALAMEHDREQDSTRLCRHLVISSFSSFFLVSEACPLSSAGTVSSQ